MVPSTSSKRVYAEPQQPQNLPQKSQRHSIVQRHPSTNSFVLRMISNARMDNTIRLKERSISKENIQPKSEVAEESKSNTQDLSAKKDLSHFRPTAPPPRLSIQKNSSSFFRPISKGLSGDYRDSESDSEGSGSEPSSPIQAQTPPGREYPPVPTTPPDSPVMNFSLSLKEMDDAESI
jgi:hypothetical protein